MTKATRKALSILREHGPIGGHKFAGLMWPESPGWRKVSKAGTHGSRRGCGMWRAGGSYLSKLRQTGLVGGWSDGYYITRAGGDALAAAEAPDAKEKP